MNKLDAVRVAEPLELLLLQEVDEAQAEGDGKHGITQKRRRHVRRQPHVLESLRQVRRRRVEDVRREGEKECQRRPMGSAQFVG